MPEYRGDMPVEEFRVWGHRLVDWVAEYLAHVDRYPVLSAVAPGEVRRRLAAAPPEEPEDVERIFADFQSAVLPGITHWNHPSFFAYFPSVGSGPGILGELLTAALNVNGMLWRCAPAATELEELAVDWLRQMLGLPEAFWGVLEDTASSSSLCAIAAARDAIADLDVNQEGLPGRREVPRLVLYASQEAHSSIDKAARILGLGQSNVRRVEADDDFRMDVRALRTAIEADLREAARPFCVVATIGTTSTTSVDPVHEIADVCAHYGLWLHVDAAYAGAAAAVPEKRDLFEGWARADSIVVNPHKWLFTPMDCSALWTRRPEALRGALSVVPEYLRTKEGDTQSVRNLMDYGIPLGRRFRALKLWMVLRAFGREGIAERLREHMRWAQELAGWVDDDPDFQRMAPAPFSTVCFRAQPHDLRARAGNGEESDRVEAYLDTLNECLMNRLNAGGRLFLSHTKVRDRYVLRFAIGNLRTTEAHVRRAWEEIQATAADLADELRIGALMF
ncbi:MAG: pyridoxal phosphate-dependent decarboxylase family protein [Gemmatimonadota bacterium]